ncbi:uncharacterized protein LOC143005430 [Genypterus blacodes]|uniref:uncharacterized protein LOC143005430 n=1 Tax=Genypterus blacodes TaxID=154954 RepID=UPI003F76E596
MNKSFTRCNQKIDIKHTVCFDYYFTAIRHLGRGGAAVRADAVASDDVYEDDTTTVLHPRLTYDSTLLGLDGALLLPDRAIVPAIAPQRHRFLLKAANQSLPLCFDVTGSLHLKLLEDPSRALSVNGELHSAAGGFKKIVIHHKKLHRIQISPTEITVREAHTGRIITEKLNTTSGHDMTSGSVTMIWTDKEIDVSDGHTRMVILLHEKAGGKFLWPVLRTRPSGDNIEGLLALQPAVYEEVQQVPSPKLKIKDQEIDVTRASAMDYNFDLAPAQVCWLMTAESALQRQLQDFTLQQS